MLCAFHLFRFGVELNCGFVASSSDLLTSVGVLAQENLPGDQFARGSSYIAASYVKYLEGAGARVVPIRYLLDQINQLYGPSYMAYMGIRSGVFIDPRAYPTVLCAVYVLHTTMHCVSFVVTC